VKLYLKIFLLVSFDILVSCGKSDVGAEIAPTNLVLKSEISTDGSGTVVFTATADGAVSFDFEYGNGEFATVPSGIVTYKYTLAGTNTYPVSVTAKSISGLTTKKTFDVTVTIKVDLPGLIWSDEFNTDGTPNPTKWGYDFPFYYAQIAPYKYGKPYEGVEVREAQRKALEVPNTGMIVLSDIGDTLNIHPRNKTDVALRLANLALNRYYKVLQIDDSGPIYKEMVIEKNRVIISFDHSEGLHSAGDKLTCFEIAGDDKVFYPGEAKIKGEKVFVTSKKVKLPVAVRFAWSNTATPNLFNGANLPASCFRTD